LSSQAGLGDVELQVFLVDDGSTDGTSAAVRREFPNVRLIEGTGQLYWTGAMLRADADAWSARPDLLLWLNDDVELRPDGVRILLDTADSTDRKAIVVGAVADPTTQQSTYGGYGRSDPHQPLRIRRVEPTGSIESLDTMNGNVVLVPGAIREAIGTLDARFSHNMADMDYGYRTSRAGWRVVLAPEFVGNCTLNKSKAKWRDPSVALRARWAAILSIRGLPPKEWLAFTRRYYGWRWPRYFLSPYARCLTCGIVGRKSKS
jgi:GT2 family glycosyltransferase